MLSVGLLLVPIVYEEVVPMPCLGFMVPNQLALSMVLWNLFLEGKHDSVFKKISFFLELKNIWCSMGLVVSIPD
jgi:hypothetical protein